MAFWSRWFNRPMSKRRFARLILERVRRSGDTSPIELLDEDFELRREDGGRMYLGNLYAQYLRTDKEQHEDLIRTFLATWHTSRLDTPDEFDDAKADLLPALRSRSYLVNLEERFWGEGKEPDFPHQVVGEHLVATLVYDLPHSMMTVNGDVLDKWEVTFYEAMEVAKQNLVETTTQYAQLGSVYALAVGDAYDATRLLLTDLIEQMEVDGDHLATAPNRERLYICGSEDEEGLLMLSKVVEEDLQHERAITGRLFRLIHGDWDPWLPPEDHPAYQAWRRLEIQSQGQDYTEQKERLDKHHAETGRDVFVASFSAMQHEETGRLTTFCSWAEGIESWLPETDEVFLGRLEGSEHATVGRLPWAALRDAAEGLMEPLGIYPERWRVNGFPDDDVLERLLAEFGID